MVIYNSIVILKKLIIASILASALWAQDLTLTKNDKTATVAHKQSIEIISKDNNVFSGRFLKIEYNSIILESSVIAINQVKEIKLQPSRLYSAFKGFAKGGLTCGGLTVAYMWALTAASPKYDEGEAILASIVLVPSAVATGGALNAIRHYVKTEEVLYKIDQDNWKIVTGK
tara:strand:- start:65 stop:580 length:516 start_codon:yes stop_codon:yes gene_type:complete